MKNKSIASAVALGLLLSTGAANADFISGSISFSDGFENVATAGATAIVSELTAFDVDNPPTVNTPNGDFTGTSAATAFDFDINALPSLFFTTDTGFEFVLTGAVLNSASPLTCSGGLCTDDIVLNVSGVVSGDSPFEDTGFLGTFSANGTCLGGDSVCTADASASWSASLTATGTAAQVPEPSTTAVLGLGLLLAGLTYRRRGARSA